MNYYSMIICGGLMAEQIELVRVLVSDLNEKGYCVRLGGDDTSSKVVFGSCSKQDINHEFYLPWAGFDGTSDGVTVNISRDIKQMRIAKENSPNWNKISIGSKCISVRNVMQLLGYNVDSPSDCLLISGYGGMSMGVNTSAIRIAESKNIPVIDLGTINESNYNNILMSIINKSNPKEIRDERFVFIR